MTKLYLDENYFNSVNTSYQKNSDYNLKCVGRQINNGVRRYTLYFPRSGSFNFYNVYYYEYDDLLNDYHLTWDSETNSLPSSCLKNIELTNEIYYRKDITNILINFIIILFICIYFPYKIISRCFGRWLKI